MSNIAQRRRQAQDEGREEYLRRRQELVEAAAGVFRTKGFDAAGIGDIAEQLGVDRTALYYYFGGKRDLFRAVILGAVEGNVARAQAIAAGPGSATAKLRALIVDLMDAYERHHPYLFVYVQEDMRRMDVDDSPQGRQLARYGEDYERTVMSVVAEGVAAGEFAAGTHPRLASYAVLGAMNWAHRWYDHEGELTGAQIGEQFAAVLLAGLCAREPFPDT
jgi:AcrR family transcriptional regulator